MRRPRTPTRVLLAVLGLLASIGPAWAEEPRPRILLTNDDGIDAPGLAALFGELARLGTVTVAAPAENQSGVGHGITYADPIRVAAVLPLVRAEGQPERWHRISARPATCVRLALAGLLDGRPDLVVSGINRGDNAGLSVYVSGTLGAAREAAFDGIPAIAVSQATASPMDYAPGAALTARIAAEVLARGLPAGTFLSVNVPTGRIRGVRVVPHAGTAGVTRYERRESPRGETYYWSVWTPPGDAPADTDVGAMNDGYATVTPLRLDLNEPLALKALKSWGLR